MTDRQQVVLEGDALGITRGICQQIVKPLVLQFAKGGGQQSVVELYASLITYLTLEVVTTLDAETARCILASAGERVEDLVGILAADAAKAAH
jgi:hypothetical protein